MITIGHVGAGSWGQNHLRIFSGLKDCYLKICCDNNKNTLKKVSSIYGEKLKLTDSFGDILKDKNVEAIVIATPAVTHASLVIKALSYGKHVFVEKPMALKIEDAIEMLRVARKNKRLVMVGHLLLYHPAVRKIKEYIKQGVLGDVRYIYSTRVNLGQVRKEENTLWSLTAHDISVAMYLLEKNPCQTQAIGRCYVRKGIQDVVFVSLDFRNNIIAHIHASWLDPHKIRKFTIVGSKKMAVFDDMETTEKIRIYDKGFDWQKTPGTYESFLTLREGDVHIPRIDMQEPLKLECQHFIDCIRTNQKPFTDGENGLEVLKVLDAAQKSMDKNGKAIKIQ